MTNKVENNNFNFVFCHSKLADCTNTECMRHSSHMPLNIPCKRSSIWKPTESGKCKGFVIYNGSSYEP